MPKIKRTITAEDLYTLEKINYPRISPDGESIVYVAMRVDRKTEKKFANLWLVPTSGGEPYQFTYGDHVDSSPMWSADGTQIAFLSNRANTEKPAGIFLIPLRGGEAHPLTHIEGEIGAFAWSPDGKHLICQVRKTDAEVLEREKDEQKKKLGVVYRHYDRVFYKFDGYGYLPKERWHLWLVDARTGKSRQLTDHPIHDELDPCWSPDGKWIACMSNRSQDPDLCIEADDLFVMPWQGGEMRKIETPYGSKWKLSFSPDGQWIAYYGSEGEAVGYKNQSLWIVPADGSAPARNLTGQHDLHVFPGTINDFSELEFMPPTWSTDSQAIFFPVSIHGSVVLKIIYLDGRLCDVIAEGGVVGSFSFSKEQNRLGYFYGKIQDACQIRVMEFTMGVDRQLTHTNRNLLKKVDLGSIEEVWFKGSSGNDLQGWILKPPGFDPSKKYPSIMEIHGGPLTQYGKLFMHEFHYLAAHGYVVYFCNPRGGRGYGEAHAKSIWGAWGSVDYADLMAWAEYAAQLPYIDITRIGVTGGSYGGYMTLWIIGHTQKFKAAVVQRCVSNFISEWGSSDVNWTFQQELEARQPFFDLEKYWAMSPIKYIGNAKTPTLVIHNEMDMRCPIEQGEQAYVALKSLGVETEMVRFPDEFHGLSRSGRTDRRIARLNHILRWFDKYLK
jgi:dipeptidyl aminopeptidase/acylaminoacyl peptidase